MATRTALRPQGVASTARSPAFQSSVGTPSETSASTGFRARCGIGGVSSSRAASWRASPRLVIPSTCTSCQVNCSTGTGSLWCQRAVVENVIVRSSSWAAGLSCATESISGIASLIA